MTIIKHIKPLSLAKIQGLIGLVAGLIAGIFAALASVFGTVISKEGPEVSAGLGALMGGLAIIGLPILYGVVMFLGGLLSAWIYNLAAKGIGGIEIELEQK